jgi:hypothetical protein
VIVKVINVVMMMMAIMILVIERHRKTEKGAVRGE